MKKTSLFLAIMLIGALPVQSGILGNGVDLSLSAKGMTMSGHTTYTIDFSEVHLFQNLNVEADYTSELEFPLDVFVTEYTFSLGGKVIHDLRWSLNASYASNANDPGNSMTDLDWMRVPQANFDEIVSSTESNAVLDADYFKIFARAAMWQGKSIRLDALLGYEYQKFSFDVVGLTGWQLDTLLHQVYFDEYKGEIVGTYEVKYKMPYAGLAADIDIVSNLDIDAMVEASPLVSASDVDNHILRNKLSESDATGAMVSINGGADYTLPGPGQDLSWVVELGYEYTYIEATGTQTQTWYGDDPATLADDTGDRFPGIRDKLKSSQYGLFLSLSLRF